MWNKKLPTGIVRVVDLAATVQLAAHDASAWRQRAVHLPSFGKKNPLDDLELSSLLFFFLTFFITHCLGQLYALKIILNLEMIGRHFFFLTEVFCAVRAGFYRRNSFPRLSPSLKPTDTKPWLIIDSYLLLLLLRRVGAGIVAGDAQVVVVMVVVVAASGGRRRGSVQFHLMAIHF